jgi:hypothetical protein
MHRVASSLSVLLVLLALSPEELDASDAGATLSPKTQSLCEREYATGDWGGQRTLRQRLSTSRFPTDRRRPLP